MPPTSGGGLEPSPLIVALGDELKRGMSELGRKADPAPYFMSYEVFDRDETIVSASYGALVQSTNRRTRSLDTDVRVGSYALDSTHPLRSDSFDFDFDLGDGAAVALPLGDDTAALRAVAWLDTDRKYHAAAEAFVKVRTQRSLKTAEEDQSDDFSSERAATYHGARASLSVDRAEWERRMRELSARFRGHPDLLDSQVTLQAASVNRAIVSSEGASIETGRNYVRVFLQATARADDGMDLERFESFEAESFDRLAGQDEMVKAANTMTADLEALRRAPLADPYIGPAILEGRAAGVFFHEIFGHRIEGHRQKNEDEGQTFARKVGQPIMPTFISVYDDPTLQRLNGTDLNGFYRFDDEGVPAMRAPLVDHGISEGLLAQPFAHARVHALERSRAAPGGVLDRLASGQPGGRARADRHAARPAPSAARRGATPRKALWPPVPRHLWRLHQHDARWTAGIQGAAHPGLSRVRRRASR